jgi:hypothetical protein
MNHLSDETLNEYLDFALTPDSRDGVDAHLAICLECAARLADWQSLFLQINSLPDLDPEVDLSTSIISNLNHPAHLPRPLWWLAALQGTLVLLSAFLAWPFLPVALPGSPFSQIPSFSEAFLFFTGIFNLWPGLAVNFQLPHFTPFIPGFDLPTTTLILAAVGLSLLWLAGNGLFFLPFSRRHS